MTRTALLLAVLPLIACSTIDDYFSNVAAEALLLGLEDAPEEVDVELGAAATASAFLAQAKSLDSVEANLIDSAELVQIVRGDLAAELDNLDDGLYEVDSSLEPDLAYTVGASYRLAVTHGGQVRDVSIIAPPPPELIGAPDPNDFHPAGQPLTIDLTGQGYNNFIALVGTVDAEGNLELTHDSRPQTAGAYVDWIRARSEVTTVDIPGTAFPSTGTPYVVAVAGIVKARDADFDGLNPLVSNFAAGSAATALVTTAP